MSYETAAFWLDNIAIGAAVAWFLGGLFVFMSAQVIRARVEGEAKIEGEPRDFVVRAKEVLTRGIANSPLSRVKLGAVHEDSLVWEGAGAGVRHSASLRASGSAGRARVVWQLEATSGLITGAIWLAAVGAVVTMGVYWVLHRYVLQSEVPPVRGQVFQMLQAIHVLWPPLLLAGIARAMKQRLVRDLDRTLSNLQFEQPT